MLVDHFDEANERRAWWALKAFAPLSQRSRPVGRGRLVASCLCWRRRLTRRDWSPAVTAAVGLALPRRFWSGHGEGLRAVCAATASENARERCSALADTLITFEGPTGEVLYDVPDAPLPKARRQPAEAHGDVGQHPACLRRPKPVDPRGVSTAGDPPQRRRTPDASGRRLRVGVWREPVDGAIEATHSNRSLMRRQTVLAAEARNLFRPLLAAREQTVYSRYKRWWRQLPGADVRLLGG